MPNEERCPSCGLKRVFNYYQFCPKCGYKYESVKKRNVATYKKCKDCKWFEAGKGMFNKGMCRNPDKKFRKGYEGYGHPPCQIACKKYFEEKDEDNKTDR